MTLLEKIKCFIEGTYPHSWLEDEERIENRDREASHLKKGTHQREEGAPIRRD